MRHAQEIDANQRVDSVRLCRGKITHRGSGRDGIAQTVGAFGDFARNYQNMRDANTIGGDKYFHCMANCQAARQGTIGFGISRAIQSKPAMTIAKQIARAVMGRIVIQSFLAQVFAASTDPMAYL